MLSILTLLAFIQPPPFLEAEAVSRFDIRLPGVEHEKIIDQEQRIISLFVPSGTLASEVFPEFLLPGDFSLTRILPVGNIHEPIFSGESPFDLTEPSLLTLANPNYRILTLRLEATELSLLPYPDYSPELLYAELSNVPGAYPFSYLRIASLDSDSSGTPRFILAGLRNDPGHLILSRSAGCAGSLRDMVGAPGIAGPAIPCVPGTIDPANQALTEQRPPRAGETLGNTEPAFFGVGDMAISDYDADGDPDLALSWIPGGSTDMLVRIFKSRNGRFEQVSILDPPHAVSTLEWIDIDNDGIGELLTGGSSSNASSLTLYQNRRGQFENLAINLVKFDVLDMLVTDYNSDGWADIVVAGKSESNLSLHVFLNDSEGGFVPMEGEGYEWDLQIYRMKLGDVEGDGDTDLLIYASESLSGSSSIFVALRENGRFQMPRAVVTAEEVGSFSWADYDLDGDLDIVVVTPKWTRLFENQQGEFTSSSRIMEGYYGASATWIDADGDGDVDLVVGGSVSPPDAGGLVRPRIRYVQNLSARSGMPSRLIAPSGPGYSFDPERAHVRLSWSPAQSPTPGDTKYQVSWHRIEQPPSPSDLDDPGACPGCTGTMLVRTAFAYIATAGWAGGSYMWEVRAIASGLQISEAAISTFLLPDSRSTDLLDFKVEGMIDSRTDTPNHTITLLVNPSDSFPGLTPQFKVNGLAQVRVGDLLIVSGVGIQDFSAPVVYHVTAENGTATQDWEVKVETPIFTKMPPQLWPPPPAGDSVGLQDVDADGRIDILVSGLTTHMGLDTQHRIGYFRNTSQGLTAVLSTAEQLEGPLDLDYRNFTDVNGDGRYDMFIAGNGIGHIITFTSNGFQIFDDQPDYSKGILPTSRALWVDVDSDGDEDLLVADGRDGRNAAALPLLFFENIDQKLRKFSPRQLGLDPSISGSLDSGDYDGDGDTDLVLIGSMARADQSGYDAFSGFFVNSWGSFEPVEFEVKALTNPSPRFTDYDQDGDLDLSIAGTNPQDGMFELHLYRNFQRQGFSFDKSISSGVAGEGRVEFVDYDGDGDLDAFIVVCCRYDDLLGSPGVVARMYENSHDGEFRMSFNPRVEGVSSASFAWGDLDLNGYPDLVMGGVILANMGPVSSTNQPPSTPSGLRATVGMNSVSLSWDASMDRESASGITYEWMVGTSPGVYDLTPTRFLPPSAGTGAPYLYSCRARGNIQGTGKTIRIEEPGTYYWRVRAVDSSRALSPPSAEASFIVPEKALRILFERRNAPFEEQSEVGTLVGTVIAEAADVDISTPTLSLPEGFRDNHLFTLGVEGDLRTASVIFFEDHPRGIFLRVAGEVEGGFSLREDLEIEIGSLREDLELVLDARSVPESQPPEYRVGIFSLQQEDLRQYGLEISSVDGKPGGDGKFHVRDGSLYTLSSFDAEAVDGFRVAVELTRGGLVVLKEEFEIIISDVDEFAPSPILLSHSQVPEYGSDSTRVGTFITIDKDRTAPRQYSYRLAEDTPGTHNGLFLLSGIGNQDLYFTGNVDYEMLPEGNKTLALGIERTGPGIMDSSLVYVEVTDTFEFAGLESPAQVPPYVIFFIASTSLRVRENEDRGSAVVNLADVADFGEQPPASLSFSIAENSLFGISPLGILQSLDSLNYENLNAPNPVALSVQFMDSYGRGEQVDLYVLVEDVNEAPIGIILSETFLFEESEPGSWVGDFVTVDEDFGDFHTYELIEVADETHNNNLFSIESNILRTAVTFDYESLSPQERILSIAVKSTDSAGFSVENRFTMTVLDVREDVNNPPTGIRLSNNKLTENIHVGSVVGTLTAIDPDLEDEHIFLLAGGTPQHIELSFSIEGRSLILAEEVLFDPENDANNVIELQFEVVDSGGLHFSSSLSLFILASTEVEPRISGPDIALSRWEVIGGQPGETYVGDFSIPRLTFSGVVSFTLAETQGDMANDNELFILRGDSLYSRGPLEFSRGGVILLSIRVEVALDGSFAGFEDFIVQVLDPIDTISPLQSSSTLDHGMAPGVYPSSTREFLNLVVPQGIWGEVFIFNLSGKLFMHESGVSHDCRIDVRPLPAGTYITKFETEQARIFTWRFIKE